MNARTNGRRGAYNTLGMSDATGISSHLALDRIDRDCSREVIAYGEWLGWLTPLRWISVGGGVVLSGAAGFSILWNTLPSGKIISAVLAFAASTLTTIHVALKCESHQSECRRLIQAYKSLSVQISLCRELTPEEHPARRAEIMMKVAHLVETANAVPGEWCYRRADRAMTQAKVEIK
jgi:hypothetical protein